MWGRVPGLPVTAVAVVVVSIATAGCGDSAKKGPDAGGGTIATISGQVVRAPGAPAPIAGVTVTVIDPPGQNLRTRTDEKGLFTLDGVRTTTGNRVRLFIDGTTGGGGPYVCMNTEFPVAPNLGTIHLTAMDPSAIVRLTSDNAMIQQQADGSTTAKLLVDISLAGGSVMGDAQNPRSARLKVPTGTTLTFPPGAPLLLNLTRIDLSAIPAPLPMSRFTNYFITLQPSGVVLSAPIGLQLPALDGVPVGSPVEFWEVDTSTEKFILKGMGHVAQIPGVGLVAQSDQSFISRFGWYASTPPCTSKFTQVSGHAVDLMGRDVPGATVRTLGLRAVTGMDGKFTIPNVPLGCGSNLLMQLSVLASRQLNDGTFLSGASPDAATVPDGMTNVGDILLTTPLYVVGVVPGSGDTVSPDTPFDVYFSEPINPATVETMPGVTVNLARSIPSPTGCTISPLPVAGMAHVDSTDPRHVRFSPMPVLGQGQQYVGIAAAQVVRATSDHSMVADLQVPFSTEASNFLATVGFVCPSAQGASYTGGAMISATATVSFDGGGTSVASATFQVLDANLMPIAGFGEIPASITSDPQNLCGSILLIGQVTMPNVTAPTRFNLRVTARDAAGNSRSVDAPITVLPPAQGFPFCGSAQSTAFVSTNGFITFDAADYDYTPTVQKFFQRPRVAALYTDVDMRAVPYTVGTTVYTPQMFWNIVARGSSDPGFAVTWLDAEQYSGIPGPDTFQIVLFQSGAIQISYEEMSDAVSQTAKNMFLGVSCGCAAATTTPEKMNLLTPEAQPDTGDQDTDIMWSGQPVYDYVDYSVTPMPLPKSQLFKTRHFNLVPPGQQPKAYVPIFRQGTIIAGLACDDCATGVAINFGVIAPAPDAGALP
jgi:hypothetical protein